VELRVNVNGDDGGKLVSIWMTPGDNTPLDRIVELRDEVDRLKLLLDNLKKVAKITD